MKKYGLKGTFNINSGLFSQERRDDGKGRMTKEEAIELYINSGMEVAIHGYKHLSLAEVESSVAVRDVAKDREELENIFGGVINGMAYANGSYSDAVVQVLKDCGVKYSRTVVFTESFMIPEDWLRLPTTCHHANPKLMELAENFLAESTTTRFWANSPKLFYLWGHSYEFDTYNNWNIIEEFAKFVGNRENVWYATNIEVYNYVTAYDSLQFSIDQTGVYNPSCLDVYLDYYGEKILVPSGKYTKLK